MTGSNSKTDFRFTAEMNGGGRPLFSADKTELSLKWRPDLGSYWHGHGGQLISQPIDNQNAYLNVYVPEDVTIGTHEITKDGKDYRASYALGNPGDIDEYPAVSGELILSVVPTAGDDRLEGTFWFKGVHEDGRQKVDVTSGEFKLTAQTASTPSTSKSE